MFNNMYEFFKINKFKPSSNHAIRIWFLQNSRRYYVSEEKVINTLLNRLWPVKLKTINIKKIKTTFFFKLCFIGFLFFTLFVFFLILKLHLAFLIERNYILSNFKEVRKMGDPYIINFDFLIQSDFIKFLQYHRMDYFNIYYYFINYLMKLHIFIIFYNAV